MLYLAFIYHMHQPYYKNILNNQADLPWVRLHGTKDYLDMVQILQKYPLVHQTFNLVPSLLEQVEDYAKGTVKDKFLELSYKPAAELTPEDKSFILQNFFSISRDKAVAFHPRYYELYFKKQDKREFDTQDYLDLQVWFNLSWIDPTFRESFPELRALVYKARFFSEEDKRLVLDKHPQILSGIIPAYKEAIERSQVEATISPYYHPILPLLYSTNTTKEANPKATLPRVKFSHPKDCATQVNQAVEFFQARFGKKPTGMWPSEESVSEHILPFIIGAGINWIVADEAILFKSLKSKKRDTRLLYQPHLLERKDGSLNIVFRDRNLSDLIGFMYHSLSPDAAVADFMGHLDNIDKAMAGQDILVTVALDGENAWEYYPNDGADFLNLLYQKLSESKAVKCVTVSEYLEKFPAKTKIKRLAAGSWIYGEFGKWIGNPLKRRAWECLAEARQKLEGHQVNKSPSQQLDLAWKQMYILEGSDWFWWYGEDPDGSFDRLFRMHLSNFYALISEPTPAYLNKPLST